MSAEQTSFILQFCALVLWRETTWVLQPEHTCTQAHTHTLGSYGSRELEVGERGRDDSIPEETCLNTTSQNR